MEAGALEPALIMHRKLGDKFSSHFGESAGLPAAVKTHMGWGGCSHGKQSHRALRLVSLTKDKPQGVTMVVTAITTQVTLDRVVLKYFFVCIFICLHRVHPWCS